MLSEDPQYNEQAEIDDRRNLTLRVSYSTTLIGKLDTGLQFVIAKLGFVPTGKFSLNDHALDKPLVLADNRGRRLTVDLNLLEPANAAEHLIFHTNDCLRDYHKYILCGVEFINRPEYNSTGLQVNFIDTEDNYYTLLEERDYTES